MPRFQFFLAGICLLSACKTVPTPAKVRKEQYYFAVSGESLRIGNGTFEYTETRGCIRIVHCYGTLEMDNQNLTFWSHQDKEEPLPDTVPGRLKSCLCDPVEKGTMRTDSIFFRNQVFVKSRR